MEKQCCIKLTMLYSQVLFAHWSLSAILRTLYISWLSIQFFLLNCLRKISYNSQPPTTRAHMKNVLLFGASGNIGQEIAKEVKRQGYGLRIVVRNKEQANQLSSITTDYVVADITKPGTLTDVCREQDIVISAVGKRISPYDHSKPGFHEVDFLGNMNILEAAKTSGVQKFIYLSAFHAEKYLHLTYARVHHELAETLKQSGLNYSIIKPPAVFSAFLDMIQMAQKGQLLTIGTGEHKTNPIYEGDLARICVDSIKSRNTTIEAGGKTVYTRKQLHELVQSMVNPGKAVVHVPAGVFKLVLPLVKLFNKNMYDKLAFFLEVVQEDTVAPRVGEMSFEEYLRMKIPTEKAVLLQ